MTEDALSIGILPRATDRSMPLIELARAAEERGFRSLFLGEHTHIPLDRTRGAPLRDDAAGWLQRMWDPFIGLAFIAAATELDIGTAVCLPVQHDAITLAKEVASLDRLSGGRLTLGIGWGWNREEVANHGYPPNERVAVLAEKLALMKNIWQEEQPSFAGRYVRMTTSESYPKPVQQPHPPILLGIPGNRRNYERISQWANGWIPHASPLLDDHFPAQLSDLRAACERVGRDPQTIDVTIVQLPASNDGYRQAIENARMLGVRRVLFMLPENDTDDTMRNLDDLAKFLKF